MKQKFKGIVINFKIIFRKLNEIKNRRKALNILKNEIKSKRKLNVGSGNIDFDPNWFSCDKDVLDITNEDNWRELLNKVKLNNIFAEHVWEHLTEEDTILANQNCYLFLKEQGRLRIAVPDGFHPSKEYIEYVKPLGTGIGSDDHKILYNYKTLSQKLQKAGFSIDLLEYWDEFGNFHFKEWDNSDGKVIRSKRFDKRNEGEQLIYTSLIIDAIKK